jgi:hypothetical protein
MSGLRLSPELVAWAELAAALVNTRPRETDPPEKLVGPADVEALLATCPEPPRVVDERDVPALRALRPQLLAAFEAGSVEAFAAAVNPLFDQGATHWRVARDERGEWALRPLTENGAATWFGARAAHALAELVLAYGVERLHVCSADDCLCAVVDVSRNGTRRYCSRTCASRMNVRRHRRR